MFPAGIRPTTRKVHSVVAAELSPFATAVQETRVVD
jgi:hypothetical protein